MSRVNASGPAFVLIGVMAVSGAKAGTIYVDYSATDSTHNGTSWCSAFLDLQDALAVAQPSDQIQVAAGEYTPDRGTGDRLATFRLKSGVTVLGGFAGCGASDPSARDVSVYPSVLSGDLSANDGPNFANYADNSYHVVTYDDPVATGVVLDGFTITSGNANGPDGLTNQGGGIHIRNGLAKCLPGGPTIRNCTVEKNWGAHHGAINDHGLGTRIETCLIRDNFADHEGGGLQIHSGSPTVTNCIFRNNASGGNGGGAWVGTDTDATCSGPSTATFTNCVFEGNSAENGGGMFQNLETAPILTRCTFVRNSATRNGGGVWFAVNRPMFAECEFIDNSATERGGGTYCGGLWVPGGGFATFEECIWDGNTSERGGGHYNVDNLGDRIVVTDSIVRNNHATSGGGGFDMYSGAPLVTNTLFENNQAQYTGGGVSNNQNIFSGDFCDPGLCEAVYENCTFRGNSVYSYGQGGGGFYAAVGARPVLRGVLFEDNYALTGGGGMEIYGFNDPGDARINPAYLDGCTFRRNQSRYYGGGLRVELNKAVTLVGCDFFENAAGSAGGGMYVYRESRVTIFNSRFIDNYISLEPTLGRNGGALYVLAETNFPVPDLLIANTLFAGNSSLNLGGAAFVSGGSAAIANSTFTNNHSPGEGDALWASGGTVEIVNSIVWNNQAGTGAALSGTLAVSHSTVEGGWTGIGNIASDPQFVDPDGIDGVPGTDDDDWRLSLTSPALNSGAVSMLPADVTDLDGDGDTSEPIPYDLNGDPRIFGSDVDMGALETSVILCDPGTFSATGQQPCTPCSPGFAQPNAGATECIPCSSGTYAFSPGLAVCSACPMLQYQPATGQSACLPCSCDDDNGCTTDTCDAVKGVCQNNAFCIIPTVSQWGVLILAILLAVAGTITIRRVGAIPTRTCMFLMALASFALPVQAGQVWFVDHQAPGPTFDGTSWCGAFLKLQDALGVAASGDEIRVADGVYRPDRGAGQIPGDRAATFTMKSAVVLMGGFAGCGAANPSERNTSLYPAILSGDLSANDGPNFANYADNSFHVVTYNDPGATNVVLDGFTLTGGNADGPDGLTNQGGGIHIRNGLVRCLPGGPTIRNCIIEKNRAAHHGAINDHAAASVFEDCTFRDNFAGEEGAGLLIHHGNATIVRNCMFERNVTDNEGGGAWVGRDQDATCLGLPAPSFVGCRFTENEGLNGGGLFAASLSSPVLHDCTFDGNLGFHQGGGLHLEDGPITINNSIFLGNTVVSEVISAGGGGLWLGSSATFNADLTDCEFRGNVARRGGGINTEQTSSIRITRGRFEENMAGLGGGLWCGGTTIITDSTFLRNRATAVGGGLAAGQETRLTLSRSLFMANEVVENVPGGGGGGISVYLGTVDIANCRFIGNLLSSQNQSGLGGGGILVNADGNAAISNSAFSGNASHMGGGATFSNGANVRVANCTFTQNAASYRGDGVATWASTVTVDNSILWDDVPGGSGIDLYAGTSSQVSCAYTNIRGGWSGPGNFSADPSFLNAPGYDGIPGTADDSLYLQLDSPCVDAGDNGRLPADKTDLDADGNVIEPIPLDLSNHARVFESVVDLGALEASINPCDPGTFSATGQQPCDPCPAGQFQPSAGATTCNPCAAGAHAPSPGAAVCTPCSPGFAQPNAGATSCVPCLPGSIAPSSGSAVCTACPAGSYQPSSGATACLSCGCDDDDFCTTNGCDAVSGVCQNQPIVGCSIPAVSDWGLTILSLLLMIAGTVVTGRPARVNR